MEEGKSVRLKHHLVAEDGPRRKACTEDWCYIHCCCSPLQHPSHVQWVVLQVSEDLLCEGLTNPVPAGAKRSSCPCVMGLKVKEVCAIVVHSCLSGSSWLAAIGKLPFLPRDAVKWPEGPQQARFLITSLARDFIHSLAKAFSSADDSSTALFPGLSQGNLLLHLPIALAHIPVLVQVLKLARYCHLYCYHTNSSKKKN